MLNSLDEEPSARRGSELSYRQSHRSQPFSAMHPRPAPINGSPYLRVAIQKPLRRFFDYLMPEEEVVPGQRLMVPFGNRTLLAIAVSGTDQTAMEIPKLRPVTKVLPDHPVPEELLALLLWASDYYHYPPGEALALALPPALRQKERKDPRGPGPLQQFWRLTEEAPESASGAPRRTQVLEQLRAFPQGRLGADLGVSAAVIRAMAEKGWLRPVKAPTSAASLSLPAASPLLNQEQQTAVDAIQSAAGSFQCLLLEGVTGSGKTEVYLRSAASFVEQGLQVLLLTPEIGLTPQIVKIFRERLPCPTLSIHSGSAAGERLQAWQQCAQGSPLVLIGTRSALFTPMPKLGLIVVDEEHDNSYKQSSGLRYSARDLAIKRAHGLGIPVVLGSATPSLETLSSVARHGYPRLSLPKRAGGASPPGWQLVDMRRIPQRMPLSPIALRRIEETLERGEQSLVFINRRGYAPVLLCSKCDWIAECSRCDARMILHRPPGRGDFLVCHRCARRRPAPQECPECQETSLFPLGSGTQRLEQELYKHFGEEQIFRIDGDKARNKKRLAETLETLQDGRGRILVGTQMLAKGHDIANLTLVVIADADGGFLSSDFRATERNAQLIMQVAGRCGRQGHLPGTVLAQTRTPDHPLWHTLIQAGYGHFAKEVLSERKDARLPPYSRMAVILAEGRDYQLCEEFLKVAAARCAELQKAQIWGPHPAPFERHEDRYRLQLILMSPSRQQLAAALDLAIPSLEQDPRGRKLRWSVDIDPLDLS